MHVEQEQERQIQLQKQQQLRQQHGKEHTSQQQPHQYQQEEIRHEAIIDSEIVSSSDLSKPNPLQCTASESLHESQHKLQNIHASKNQIDFQAVQSQQYVEPTQVRTLLNTEKEIVIQGDSNLDSPLKSTTPVKYITHSTTKAQMQGFKIIPQEQSVQQIRYGGGVGLVSGSCSTPNGTIPVYVAMQTGGTGQQNQPKLVPITVIAKPQTQQQHCKNLERVIIFIHLV